MTPSDLSPIHSYLLELYGQPVGDDAFERLCALLNPYLDLPPARRNGSAAILSERDNILITYADQLKESDTPALQTLAAFCEQHLSGLINSIHVLPFFPYSSDDGFSVINYQAVRMEFGDWQDIERLGRHFRLMFDAVINHASVRHEWFQAFLRDDPDYREYFIVVDGKADLSKVVRPRALPLLTN